MMFDGLYQDQAEQALNAKAMRPPEPDPNARRFSMWGLLRAPDRGLRVGAAQALGSAADVANMVDTNMRKNRQGPFGDMGIVSLVQALPSIWEDIKNPKEGTFTSDAGTSLRNVAQDVTPDAQTTHVAESAVFNLFRVGSKAVTAASTLGVLPGAVVAGAEEGFSQADDLARQGVDINTRTKVGAVTGAVNTVGFGLPAAGKTWLQTGALALAGGPASFMVQNAATREILQNADYTKLADQFDPFDPVGLTLSTVVPLGFGAMAMRGAKVKGGAAPDAVNPATDAAPKVAPPDDVVDAARVTLVRQQMDAANPVPERLDMADAHVTAYTQAMDQMAAGDRVQVADIAPNEGAMITKWAATVAKVADEAQAAAKAEAPAQVADVQQKATETIADSTRGKNMDVTNPNDVVGNTQGGRSADDTTPGVSFDAQGAFEKHGGSGDVNESTDIRAKSLAFAEMAESEGYKVAGRGDKYVTITKSFGKDADGYDKQATIKVRISDHSNVNRGHHFGESDINIAPDDGYSRDTFDDALIKIRSAYVNEDLDTVIPKGAPSDARLGYAIATEQAQRGKPSDGSGGNPTTNESTASDSGGAPVQANGVNKVSPLESRIAELEARTPQMLDAVMPVEFDDSGKPVTSMTVRDYIDMVKREADQDTADADLIEVAANCFLRGGL